MRPWVILRTIPLAVALAAAPAAAQSAGTVEIGVLGRYHIYDDAEPYENAVGPGARLGLFVHPRLSLEAEGVYLNPDGRDIGLWSGRALYNHPLGWRDPVTRQPAAQLLAGVGYSRLQDMNGRPAPLVTPRGQHTVQGLAGMRFGLPAGLSARVEGTLNYSRLDDGFVEPDRFHWGIQAGVSALLGGREVRRARPAPVVVVPEPVRESPPVIIILPEPEPVREAVVVDLGTVYFAFDRTTLTPTARRTLREAADVLLDDQQLVVSLRGHTDATGRESYNQALSERRAAAVRQYLVSLGVEADRITTRGFGESEPAADNRTPEGRAKNRRVEVEGRTPAPVPPPSR